MTDDAFGLRRIGQIRIQVTDVDRAVAFCRDVLGMSFLYAFPGMGFFDADGVRLMLVEPEGRAFGGASAIYYRVDDIGQAVKTLEARGVASTTSRMSSTGTPPTTCGWPSPATPTATSWR